MRNSPTNNNIYNYNYNTDLNNTDYYDNPSDDHDFQIDERTALLAMTGGVIGTVASIISTYTAYLAFRDIEKNRQKQLKANARIETLESQVRYLMQQNQRRN